MQAQRREAFLAEVVDPGAELAQGVHQLGDRPLAQPRDAVEAVGAGRRGERRGEEAEHGAAGAAEDGISPPGGVARRERHVEPSRVTRKPAASRPSR